MRMSRVPLIGGPGHGRTYTMDLDWLEKQGFIVFAEEGNLAQIQQDADIDKFLEGVRVNYHTYKPQRWSLHGGVYTSLWHDDQDCICVRKPDEEKKSDG